MSKPDYPFIQMVEADLRRFGVDEALISGWKYDALKVLYPDKAGLLEQAKSLILYSAVINSRPQHYSRAEDV